VAEELEVTDGTPEDESGVRVTPLPGGRHLVVRPATRGDVEGLTALYDGLEADDSYRRFFSLFRPDRAFMERMASAEERGGEELVAVVARADAPDAGDIVAEAGYRLLPEGDGELSMVVARAWRGWLGPYLLDILLRRAAARGVPNLRADVLATNGPMLAMLCARGWARVHENDWSTVRVIIGTAGSTPTWPGRRARRPRIIVEVPGARWHAGEAARKAGFDVLACGGPRGDPTRCPALRGQPCPLVVGADVLVVSHARDDAAWRSLAETHQRVHAGVPIVIEPPDADDTIIETIARLLA
jgi:hypothetical protein